MVIGSFTNRAQILLLVEAGLDYRHADCCLAVKYGSDDFILFLERPERVDPKWQYYPCWSLGALIRILPNPLFAKDKIFYSNFDFSAQDEGTLAYVSEDYEVLHLAMGSPIKCVVDMIQWLLVNHYLSGK